MIEILTPRLALVLLTEEFLAASLEPDRALAENLAPFSVPQDWFESRDFIHLRRYQLAVDPGYAPWCVRAIVLASSHEMIGHIGFHEPPDPTHLRRYGRNAIEFGYTVYPAFQRHGYATEAVQGLMTWAANDAGVETFVVSISPGNSASQAIARRFGFAKVDEHIDDKDGPEDVLVLRATDLPRDEASADH